METVNEIREDFEFEEKKTYDFFKRIIDVIVSFVLIIALFPLMLVVALVISADGGHPIYVQTRVGKDGKLFKMFKFRSMCIDADSKENLQKVKPLNEMDGPAFKASNDPRVTKIGKILRKTSIDELPQLFNILIGDMTFVGPRPPLVSEVKKYTDYHKNRLRVKQGLTCYWQCGGRNDIKFEEWVRLDLKYIRERSLLTDLKIILLTVPAVFSGKGAN